MAFKLKFLFVIPFVFSALLSQAQYSIHGVVIDAATNKPLPGANAFLANTTKGASADVNGEFMITNLKAINYQLVVSFIGYKTLIYEINPETPINLKIVLEAAPELLKEVVVHSKKLSKKEWQDALKIFTEHFIGSAENAKDCEVANPKSLDFEKNGNVLTAFTDSTLVIENRGLGYKVKVLLQDYRYNVATTQLIYVGPMSYELLTPKNQKEKIRWARNRLKAYNGSQMHFFRALHDKKLNDEGFYFRMDGKLESDDSIKTIKSKVFRKGLQAGTIVNYDKILHGDTLRFKKILEVLYVNESESRQYQLQRSKPVEKTPQLSMIKMNAPAFIQFDGQPSPVDAVQAMGYWSWELMSETLPLDYEPAEDIALVND